MSLALWPALYAIHRKRAEKINHVMVRVKYGTHAERYWGVLRTAINDLARCYNLTPLGV
jgi:hypothetical protein